MLRLIFAKIKTYLMKKILFLLVTLCISTFSHSQIRVVEKKESLSKFKGTQTIFLLSNVYDTKTYEELLKDTWTVTPFKVIKYEDFNPQEYVSGAYSFVTLAGSRVQTAQQSVYHSAYMHFFMFNTKAKEKELKKWAKKPEEKKKEYNLMAEDRIDIGSVTLCVSPRFIEAMYFTPKEAWKVMYEEDTFPNYKLGFLKNYFQKMSNVISEGKGRPACETECTPELKALKKQTLYIPNFIIEEYINMALKGNKAEDEGFKKLFKEYKYKYEIIDDETINIKILAGEEFYYVRFIEALPIKHLQVVNSKTGDLLFSHCLFGLDAHIKPNNLKDIKTAIDTGKF